MASTRRSPPAAAPRPSLAHQVQTFQKAQSLPAAAPKPIPKTSLSTGLGPATSPAKVTLAPVTVVQNTTPIADTSQTTPQPISPPLPGAAANPMTPPANPGISPTAQNPPQQRNVIPGDGGGGDGGDQQQDGGSDAQQDDQPQQQDDQPQDQPDDQPQDDGQQDDTQDQGDAQDDASVQGDVQPQRAARFSAYVQGPTLCGMALCNTPWGNVPLVTAVPIGKMTKNGPPQFGEDSEVDAAVEETKRRLMQGSELEAQRLAVESLVRRVNQGDQNAMAMIQMIGVNARNGDEKAKRSASFILRYASMYPQGSESTMNGDMQKHYLRGAVRLANGPTLTNHMIRHMASTFGGKHARNRKVILKTAANFGAEETVNTSQMDPMERRLYDLGQCIGFAAGLQCIRNGGPISKLSKRAAWELGE